MATPNAGPPRSAHVLPPGPVRPSVEPDRRPLVVMLTRFGGPEGFAVSEQPMPRLGPGEVRIHVLAASVQVTDVLVRTGRYPGLKARPPLVLGYDVVGEIIELGAGVAGFAVGDRVADLTVTGSYARYRILRADQLVRVPPGVDPAEATALVLSWVTAYQLLHRVAQVTAGQRVLVHGAAGSVGQAMLTLGRIAGLRMWGTARPEHAELVRALGATPIDYQAADPRGVVGGFDAVFDAIGERGFARSWPLVRRGGTLAAYGFSQAVLRGTQRWQVAWWLLRLTVWRWWPNGKAARFYSITTMRKRNPAWYFADLGTLLALLAARAIQPRIADRITLDEVADAHRRLEAGGLAGKLILCP